MNLKKTKIPHEYLLKEESKTSNNLLLVPVRHWVDTIFFWRQRNSDAKNKNSDGKPFIVSK